MAFLPPSPLPARAFASATRVRTSPFAPPLPSAPPPSPARHARCALPHEFSSMSSAAAPDLTLLPAVVKHVTPVCPSQDHVQVTLSVGPAFTHAAPGQFVQLSRQVSALPWRRQTRAAFATIASPPGATGEFDVLVNRRNDPLRLATMRVGEELRVSTVLGKGLDWETVTETKGDLYVFADAPQGFAAAKSLIEWGRFRALSGEGANRTNRVTVFYSIPSGRSLPYADRLSAWSVYGVNVVPLAGTSVLEYLSAPCALGKPEKSLTEAFAMACVASDETFESLFSMLLLYGFRRKAVQKLTQEVVAREGRLFDEGEEFEVGGQDRPFGMPDPIFQQMKRDRVESEVWQSWVGVREGMRVEFERKWAAQARVNSDHRRGEEEKRDAWASWCARNSEQWTQVSWDKDLWGAYWSSWGDTNDKWQAKGAWDSAAGDKWGQNGYAWDQQNSKEYWDGVSHGNGPRRSASSAHDTGRGYQQWQGSSYTWGTNKNQRSGYQQGGYRYQYEESADGKSAGAGAGSGGGGSGSGSGGGWSGWNRQQSSWRGSSTGSKRAWNTGRASSFGEADFYAVLGIESGASRADIKRAYRRKAMEHHPDRNPGKSEQAHVMMKEIVVAWSVLKDEDKRRRYDSEGPGRL